MYIIDKKEREDLEHYFRIILVDEGLGVNSGRWPSSRKRRAQDSVQNAPEGRCETKAEKHARKAEQQLLRDLKRRPGYVAVEAQQMIETEIRIIRTEVVDVVDEIKAPEPRPTFAEVRASSQEFPNIPDEVHEYNRRKKAARKKNSSNKSGRSGQQFRSRS